MTTTQSNQLASIEVLVEEIRQGGPSLSSVLSVGVGGGLPFRLTKKIDFIEFPLALYFGGF